MRKIFRRISILLMVTLLVNFTGCAGKQQTQKKQEGKYYLYYANEKATGLEKIAFSPKSQETLEIINEMLRELSTNTTENDITSTIPNNITVSVDKFEDKEVSLNFSGPYKEMNPVDEIILRSSVVLSLCQLKDVSKVSFTLNGEVMKNSRGEKLRGMKASDFVNNSDDIITAFQHQTLTLYFGDEKAEKLKKYTCECVLSNNVSLAQYIVDQVIQGPQSEGYTPTISKSVKVNSVSIENGICYVDFTDSLLNNNSSYKARLTIYSIVNSLAELTNVTKVQFLIDGKNDITYQNEISFLEPFQRNLDDVEKTEDETRQEVTRVEPEIESEMVSKQEEWK